MIERLASALDGEEMEDVMKKANKVMTSNIASYIASTLKEANRDIDKEKSEGKLIAYELVKNPKQYDLKKIYIEKAADREKPQYIRNVDNIVEVIRTVGEWYASNVYTYQAGTYGAESFSNATGIVTYYQGEQEQMYQDKFRESFRENWLKSSSEAKDNRQNYMINNKVPEDRVNLIMQDINVVDTVMNGTFNELNVDVLKQNERYTTNDRLTTINPKIFGYYNNPFVNSKAQDDCSSFVSIVIYLFVNNNKDIKEKYQKVPNYTSARLLNNDTIKIELESKGFVCYDNNNSNNDYRLDRVGLLQSGDILVREGHVEFYLGDNWSFGWGEVHNSFEDNPHSKDFKWHFGIEDEVENSNKPEGYYFYNKNKNSEGHYTRVYRYKGVNGD